MTFCLQVDADVVEPDVGQRDRLVGDALQHTFCATVFWAGTATLKRSRFCVRSYGSFGSMSFQSSVYACSRISVAVLVGLVLDLVLAAVHVLVPVPERALGDLAG